MIKKEKIKNQIEQVLSNKDSVTKNAYSKSLEQLIEELKIYQYELEFQNEELIRIQGELEESENQFRQLYHHAPIGYVIVDETSKIIDFNHTFQKMVIPVVVNKKNMDFRKFIHAAQQDDLHFFMRKLLDSGKPGNLEIQLVSTGNSVKYVSISGNVFKDSSGNGFIRLGITDVTTRVHTEKALIESEQLWRTIIKTSPDGIFITDSDGKILQASDEAHTILGYGHNELVGKNGFDLVDKEDHKLVMSVLNEFEQGHYKNPRVYHLIKKDGSKIPVESSITILKNQPEDSTKYIYFTRDIAQRLQKEETIRIQKEELQIILDSVPAWVFYKDKTNRFMRVNEPLSSAMGKTNAEMEGRTMWEFYPKEQADAYWQDDLAVINSGLPKRDIIEQVTVNDNIRWVKTDKIPYRDTNGNIIGIIGFTLDITEQKRDESLILQLSTAVDQSPVSIAITDVNGKIEYYNPKFSTITGYSKEEILGKTHRILKSGELSADKYKELWDTITSGYEWKGEFHNKKKNGQLYWESAAISPIKNADGAITNFLAVKEDITDRKVADENLKNNAKKLSELNATKDKFFSIIAHDLKSPFNSILGFSKILSDEAKHFDVESIASYAEIINASAKRTFQLLENLLDWATVQKGEIQFEPKKILLHGIVKTEIENLQLNADQKNISIENKIPEDTIVTADENMLSVIIRNLVANAVKFTPKNGTVTVTFENIGSRSKITVTDTGIGMTRENIKNLFSIETNFSTRGTENEKGTGLGLLLCKEFVERHGGTIVAESEPGKGSRLSFTIL